MAAATMVIWADVMLSPPKSIPLVGINPYVCKSEPQISRMAFLRKKDNPMEAIKRVIRLPCLRGWKTKRS
jgi:hypothetical protein